MSQSPTDGRLVLLPSLRALRTPSGRVVLTKKLVEGVEEYQRTWRGPVRLLMEAASATGQNLDYAEYEPKALPFELQIVDFTSPELARTLADCALVYGSVAHRQNHLARLCARMGIPLLYAAEYSLKTRLQIAKSERLTPLLLARRSFWELRQEARQVSAIRAARGVQCNGTPTYELYRHVNANCLLYFDTRTRRSMVIAPEALERRLSGLNARRPLRLLFSGRLERMKGANYLPDLAVALQRRGVPFTLVICGGGSLEPSMRNEVQKRGLDEIVAFKGSLDFSSALLPLVSAEADLFVCPHVQGDPSCTYLETFACGVPIAGFANEAFLGLTRRVNAGFAAPIGEVEALADLIARLDAAREKLASASRAARSFALQHTFEATFARRVEHMRESMSTRSATTRLLHAEV